MFKCVDSRNSGQPQFPSTAKKAEENFTAFLNKMGEEGWNYAGTFTYDLGVEKRTMFVFQSDKAD